MLVFLEGEGGKKKLILDFISHFQDSSNREMQRQAKPGKQLPNHKTNFSTLGKLCPTNGSGALQKTLEQPMEWGKKMKVGGAVGIK